MCAAKKAIGKMPLRTVRNGDEVSLTACQQQTGLSSFMYGALQMCLIVIIVLATIMTELSSEVVQF